MNTISTFFVPGNKKRTKMCLFVFLFQIYFFVPKNKFGTETRNNKPRRGWVRPPTLISQSPAMAEAGDRPKGRKK